MICELLLEHLGPVLDRREREAVAPVLLFVPARAESELDPTAAHLVDGRDDLGEVARVAEADRRDEDAEADPVVSRASPAMTVQASVVGCPAGPGKLS